ncbi:hypothetical protein J5J86_18645 [Aquabacter sp. L1I39]|uniref:hypothetical protein n=1 Tax=Aquabacter sp. L1I39 TaxID=2820278 RepID=UPI001ADBCBF7|nr:hypothetical protein [Aquabacter sp. L1I39]QTL02776.1 hypothetical protein J5J86_18645 [Aquabacter sp. L1I39]
MLRIPAPALAACTVLALAAAPALAQIAPPPPAPPAPPPPGAPARYNFVPVDGGALKLDTVTGKVSFCGRSSGAYVCEAVPDTRDAYEAEIGRLQQQVETLQGGKPAAGEKPALPDESHLDAAMDYAERLMLRLKQMLDNLRAGEPANPT